LIEGAAERWPDARDRPSRLGEPGQPVDQRLEVVERNVIQKRVAAVQITGDASRLDVPGNAFGGVEIETPSSVGPARKRGDRKDAGELLRINRTTQHQQRISRNALDCSACND
jgi:hypothetical protein